MIWFWGCETKEILFIDHLENMKRGQGFYDAKGSRGWFYPTFYIKELLPVALWFWVYIYIYIELSFNFLENLLSQNSHTLQHKLLKNV